jgi:hypothetical protein
MRSPREMAPKDIPPGTVQISGPADWFTLSLSVSGQELDPDDISKLLGVAPSRIVRIGERIYPSNPRSRISDVGILELSLDPSATDDSDVVKAAERLISQAAATPSAWLALPAGCTVYLDAGIHMTAMSGGFWMSPTLMKLLGERNIEARFDIYDRSVPRGR